MLNQVVQLPLPVIIHCSLTPTSVCISPYILTPKRDAYWVSSSQANTEHSGALMPRWVMGLPCDHCVPKTIFSLGTDLCLATRHDHLIQTDWDSGFQGGLQDSLIQTDWDSGLQGVSRPAVRTKQRCRGWRTIVFEILSSLWPGKELELELSTDSSFVFWMRGRKVFQKNTVRGLNTIWFQDSS